MADELTYEQLISKLRELEEIAEECERAKEELRESERRFRAIFDQTFQFIGLLSTDGILIEANRTACEFVGISSSDVIGKPFWETPWWNHSGILQEKLREAIAVAAGGQLVRLEVTHPMPDGALRTIDFSLKPVIDENRKVIMLIPEGRDITDRKAAEEALRESENTARALLNATTESAALLDCSGKILVLNKVAAEWLGRSPAALAGQTAFDVLPDSLSPLLKQAVTRVTENASPEMFSAESGGRYYDTSVYPVLDWRGQVCRVAVFTRDVTDIKIARARIEERTAELASSEEKYRTLVENVPLVVYRMRPAGDMLFANQFVESLLGYSPTELTQNHDLWASLVHEQDRDVVEAFRKSSFEQGRELAAEYRLLDRQGEVIHVVDRAIPSRDDSGKITSIDGILLDVTGRVHLQEELLRAEGLRTVSQVSARLAHEIRNPLVAAGGFARRLLLGMGLEDPNRTKVEIIIKEVARLEIILKTILIYLQPVELKRHRCDLNPIVQEAMRAFEFRATEKNIKLSFNPANDLDPISLDDSQISGVVNAVLESALREARTGTTLEASTEEGGDFARVIFRYMADHLSADDIEHLFFPFAAPGGSIEGFGLPMAKIVVAKHGGDMNARATADGHLEISISLPRKIKSRLSEALP